MRTLTLRSAFSAAVVALALTACPGDSDDDGSTSDPTNTTPPQTDPSAGTTSSGTTGPDDPTTTTDTPATESTNTTPPATETTDTTPPETETTNTTPPDETSTTGPDDTTTSPDDTTSTGPDPDTTDTGKGLSFEVDVYAPIISVKCSCHVAGASGGLAMPDATTAYANLVGVPAVGLPTMNRVTAGDSDNSYIFHKINGTHLDVGGVGGKMPLGGSLDGGQISTIANWINDGALP